MSKQGNSRGLSKNEVADLPKAKLNLENLKKSLRLFSYLIQHRLKFFLGMFFLIGTASVGLLFPLKSGALFGFFGNNTIPPAVLKAQLYQLGLLLLIILLIQGVF